MSSESTSDLKDQQITDNLGVPYTKCVGQSKVRKFFFALQKPYCKLEGSLYAKKKRIANQIKKNFKFVFLVPT